MTSTLQGPIAHLVAQRLLLNAVPVPVPVKLRDFTARCLVIQVLALKVRWVGRCLDLRMAEALNGTLFLLQLSLPSS